jgi:hypothetical protein
VNTDRLLSDVGRQLRARDRRLRWFTDPALFAREYISWPTGTALTLYQEAALTHLAAQGRLAVRSPHGSGKTTLTALVVLWFAATRDGAGEDWKIITTAGAWRQLERYLWPEIRLWASRLRWNELGLSPWRDGREVFDLALKLKHGQAFAAASDSPSLLEGAHANSLMVCLDEAKSIPGGVFDAVEGALSGPGKAFALATSTPGAPAGRFYDICSHRPGFEDWGAQHVTLDDAVTAGRVSREWAEQRALQWGRGSSVYLNRVLGEFAAGESDGVIPLSWIEAAVERWHAWEDAGRPESPGRRIVSCDPARFGTDQTAIAVRQGNVVLSLECHHLEDTMATTGRVAAKLKNPSDVAIVDVIGIGSGVVDRLREQHHSVTPFNASERSVAHDRIGELGFVNRRSEMWWQLREALDPTFGSTICLPDDDLLVGDLCSPKWSVTSAAKISVEIKDDIRKRLGRNTDSGDAVAQAFVVSGGYTYYPAGKDPMEPVPWDDGPLNSRESGVYAYDWDWRR